MTVSPLRTHRQACMQACHLGPVSLLARAFYAPRCYAENSEAATIAL